MPYHRKHEKDVRAHGRVRDELSGILIGRFRYRRRDFGDVRMDFLEPYGRGSRKTGHRDAHANGHVESHGTQRKGRRDFRKTGKRPGIRARELQGHPPGERQCRRRDVLD